MALFRQITAFALIAALAGCGADGEPIEPTVNAGVSITPNGISPNLGVGIRQGPFSILFGI